MAAVLAGIKSAGDDGYTHALQIDADGQHCPDDIPEFLRTAKDNPRALINGCPVYDKSAPKSRVFGRKITNFWVWIETGSRSIKDAMCGFRVYPLAPMKAVFRGKLVFKGMGGDIEILVRACWHGIQIINVGARVIYPESCISNFSMLKDNLKFFALHTMLVWIMLKKRVFGGTV
jgi:hypothetical protein